MSSSSLLSGTNSQRAASSLGALALNGVLGQAAQNKANDMVARDYWSHNTPDGQTPWTFITAVGYGYQAAGENLAYGFATASDTITGWMNSPGHRANILNTSFSEVGFGVANSANYQGGGPQTVVVAMYALPVGGTPPAAPAPTPTPAPTPAPSPTPTPAPSPTASGGGSSRPSAPTQEQTPTAPAPAELPAPEPIVPTPATKQGDPETVTKAADSTAPQKVSRLQVLTATNVGWSQFAVSMLASVALLAFLLRHSFAWHKVLVRGEKFILHHPFLDIVFVAVATLGFILLQTTGTIR
ncbi:CAP domain-containing protein [Candidatus Saccharibacteria bacterium]|nr:MAG: CAP domain-containing protein [Candidatus Saccharibacteria bacterium]